MMVFFVSLGCDKNLVDSEVMLGLLRKGGFQLTDNEKEAEVIVINTCCFIHDAKEESIQTIIEMAENKKQGVLKALVVTGCLAERYRDEIQTQIPEVDAVVGTTGYEDIVAAIEAALNKTQKEWFHDISYLPLVDAERVNTTGGTYSYLKIAEGCNKHCTYCIIPKIRGEYRSVPMERLISEAEKLASSGIKELILVAQETSVYGIDLYNEKKLPELLRKLCAIEGFEWIRILYCYPEEIDDALIEVIKNEKKICKYLDLPIQHASDSILHKMGRKTTGADLKSLINKLRSEIPDIVIRTSLITGFPGETEEDFKELKAFVKDVKFERLGVFTYSKEDGTPAAKMRPQITKKVKLERKNEIMLIQQKIAFKHAKEMIGKTLTVQTEGMLTEENVYVGRSYMDSPNIDGYVFFTAMQEPMSGDYVNVKITSAKNYDLIGEAI